MTNTTKNDEPITLTTEEVREAYQLSGDGLDFKSEATRRGLEFDAWLAAQRPTTPTREQVYQAARDAVSYRLNYRERMILDAVLALLSKPTPSTPSGTDVLASDEEMAEFGEAERHQVPTDEDIANAFRAEGWDRAYDDLVYVQFPNRNPFRTPSPSTPSAPRVPERQCRLYLDAHRPHYFHLYENRAERTYRCLGIPESVRIEDMAPGTTFETQLLGGVEWYRVRTPESGAQFYIVDSKRYIDRLSIDPSTVRDITPPPALPEDGEPRPIPKPTPRRLRVVDKSMFHREAGSLVVRWADLESAPDVMAIVEQAIVAWDERGRVGSGYLLNAIRAAIEEAVDR